MYYILCLERTRSGRAVWWGPNHMGYTENLDLAGKYTEAEAFTITKTAHYDDLPVPVKVFDD